MKKKDYQKPAIDIVELEHQQQLLTGSNPAPTGGSFDDYEDGAFSW